MTTQPRKAYKGIAMEGVIASWYARNTARDQRRFKSAALAVADRVPAGGEVLEVAPGPGYLAIEIARSGRKVTTLDISQSFVRIARENATRAGVAVDIQHGNASAMPFADASFDFVICMAAFKNFTDPVGALNEIHRVLRPGGRAAILDLRRDATSLEIRAEVRGMHLSPLNAWLTQWIFKHQLVKSAYPREELVRMAADSRFQGGEVIADGIGCELRLFKQSSQASDYPKQGRVPGWPHDRAPLGAHVDVPAPSGARAQILTVATTWIVSPCCETRQSSTGSRPRS